VDNQWRCEFWATGNEQDGFFRCALDAGHEGNCDFDRARCEARNAQDSALNEPVEWDYMPRV
jgi:hypothetical protein